MNYDEIQNMWELDCKIDDTELADESLNIPNLHSKYSKLFNEEKLKWFNLNKKYLHLKRLKWEYYTGKLDYETIQQYSWIQFQYHLNNKDEVNLFLESDMELSKLEVKKYHCEIKINFLESILKIIQSRNFIIKNAIEWKKYLTGF